MSKHADTLEFLNALADVQGILREIHIVMENSGRYSSVSTSLFPSSGQDSFDGSARTSLNFYINGEMKHWRDPNKKAMGFSLSISHCEGTWTLENEYGWSGQEVGWDPIHSTSSVYHAPEDFVLGLNATALALRSSALEFLSKQAN